MNPTSARAWHPIIMLVMGMGTVVVLAWQRLIVDGETVGAMSAVLSAVMGTRAIEQNPPRDPPKSPNA